MKFVELTARDGGKIFINPQMVGHVYSETETGNWGGEEKGRVITVVGMLTNKNGWFRVLETVEDVIHKIKLASIH